MGGGKTDQAIADSNNATTLEATESSNDTDLQIAKEQAETGNYQAELDTEARVKEAELNLEAVKVQAEVDLEIAKMEYEVEMEKAKNDAMRITMVEAVNAQANMVSAKADKTAADAKVIDAEGDASPDIPSYYYGFGSGYNWYS
jgi:hypothetical protein